MIEDSFDTHLVLIPHCMTEILPKECKSGKKVRGTNHSTAADLLSLFIDDVHVGVGDVVEDLVVDALLHVDTGPVLGPLPRQEGEERPDLGRLRVGQKRTPIHVYSHYSPQQLRPQTHQMWLNFGSVFTWVHTVEPLIMAGPKCEHYLAVPLYTVIHTRARTPRSNPEVYW